MMGSANNNVKNNHVLNPPPSLRVTKYGINTTNPAMAKLLKLRAPGPSAGSGAFLIAGSAVVFTPHSALGAGGAFTGGVWLIELHTVNH